MLKVDFSLRSEMCRVEVIFEYYIAVELSEKHNFLLTWIDLGTLNSSKICLAFWRIRGSRRLRLFLKIMFLFLNRINNI